jgi:hypothetical protein
MKLLHFEKAVGSGEARQQGIKAERHKGKRQKATRQQGNEATRGEA